MTAVETDPFTLAQTLLAAASTSKGELAVMYTARARAALDLIDKEVASLRLHLDAREKELTRLAGLK